MAVARPGATTLLLTAAAMFAFAGNSVLCRLALSRADMDPGAFTLVRIASGAATLAALSFWRSGGVAGSWPGAAALWVYAAAFSLAYATLSTATGALVLFGSVQATMVLVGLARGETLRALQGLGFALALAGLVALLGPGASAPSAVGAALMATAGIAWGVYSLMGRAGGGDPLAVTAGNFVRATPLALLSAAPGLSHAHLSVGLIYAALSGALASGVGYSIWYRALPRLTAAQGASVQLSVPAIAALGGALFVGEPPSLRLVLASLTVLGGVALVTRRPS